MAVNVCPEQLNCSLFSKTILQSSSWVYNIICIFEPLQHDFEIQLFILKTVVEVIHELKRVPI